MRSATEHAGDGFAIILSGAGSDGAIGVRAGKEAGGIILVQDPEEAIPRSAIAFGVAAFILPVRDLAARVVELIRVKRTVKQPEEPEVDEELLRRVLAHLRVRTGHDFSKYARPSPWRGKAAFQPLSKLTSVRIACGDSSSGKVTAIGSAKRSAIRFCSQCATRSKIRRFPTSI